MTLAINAEYARRLALFKQALAGLSCASFVSSFIHLIAASSVIHMHVSRSEAFVHQ